jgi:uncharacterized SAM-binding protein YcdF (DUF218 family)
VEKRCILWSFSLSPAVDVDGRRFPPDTLATLQATRAELRRGAYMRVLLVGGKVATNQPAPLALQMYNWLAREFSPYQSYLLEGRSLTTRENILFGFNELEQAGINPRGCEHVVVSEKYHVWGIQLLFWRLYGVWPKAVHSDHKIDFRGLVGRLLRLPYYLVFPRGGDIFGRRVAKKRSDAAAGS